MISDYLNKNARFCCIKAGALAYASAEDCEQGQEKTAGAGELVSGTVGTAKSLAILAALTAGVPIGVFGHIMDRRITGRRLKEEELREKIKLYQTAADEMASGLAGGAK